MPGKKSNQRIKFLKLKKKNDGAFLLLIIVSHSSDFIVDPKPIIGIL